MSARGLVLGEAGRARIEAEASLATLAEQTAMAATASEGAAFLRSDLGARAVAVSWESR